MLCPSKLFFGTPDPEPPLDEKSLWLGTANIWPDSDADERTDVPAEQSLEASWNESEESEEVRRSFVGLRHVAAAAEERKSPALGQQLQRPLADPPPPGLPRISTDEIRGPALVQPASNLEAVAAAEQDESEAEEEADDERSNPDDEDDGQVLKDEMNVAKDGTAPRYSELPSIGSALHFSGNCDRCCFHPKGRCHNGFNCQHCHFDHEKRKRKNKKKNKTKQLQLTGCDAMDLLSMEGSSAPVSPDQPFGPGLLPPPEFQVPVATNAPHNNAALGSTPFLPPQLAQQSPYFSSLQVPRPPTPSGAPDAADSKWYHHAAPHPPPQTAPPAAPPAAPTAVPGATLPSSLLSAAGLHGAPPAGPPPAGPPPQAADGGASFASGPPSYEFGAPMPPHDHILSTVGNAAARADRPEMDLRYTSEQDKRDLYIRHLESENRYLRACLIQCLGPNAVLDPPLGAPGSCTLPEVLASGPPSVAPGMQPNMASLQPDGMGAPLSPFSAAKGISPPAAATVLPPGSAHGLSSGGISIGGLSPSAPPFWPVGTQAVGASPASNHQVWADGGSVGNPRMETFTGAATVRLHQDAEGCVVSTSGG